MNINEALRAARERLSQGWCQGTMGRLPDGRGWHAGDFRQSTVFCALGAIKISIYDSQLTVSKVALLLSPHLPADFLPELQTDTMRVAAFNDTPGRTKEEVLALFDAAITATIPVVP